MDQLILSSPKVGPTSSHSKGLDFMNWKKGEREGREAFAAQFCVR